MNTLRKSLLFFIAALLTAFALPVLAHGSDESFSLVISPALPTVVAAPPSSVTATIKNLADDDDKIKSFKITSPAGVQITSATAPGVSASNITIAADKLSVAVKNVSIYKYNSLVVTLGTTFPAGASCGTNNYTWGAQAWEGTFGGDSFALSGSSKRVTSISAACNYSLTGDSSVVAGSSPTVTMTLTNNATAGGPTITAVTLTPPAGVTITSPVGGAFTGLSVAPGTSTALSVAVSTPPSCVGAGAAAWGVSSVLPANFVINPPGSYPKTTITGQTCSLSLSAAPTSVVKDALFSQTVTLTNGAGNALVKLEAIAGAPGTTCPALSGVTQKSATPTAGGGGSVTFDNLSFAAIGNCTLKATDATSPATSNPYSPATKAFDIFTAGNLVCNGDYPTSTNGGPIVLGNPTLDPDADTAFVFPGDPNTSWGLKRGDNVNGAPCSAVNYTLTISPDNKISNLLYDKSNGQGGGSFKYVLAWPGVPVVAWPNYRPDVAWVVDNMGAPIYVPGIVCQGDDLSNPGAIMPLIPNEAPFTDAGQIPEYKYDGVRKAKMCIAQVGWSVDSGLLYYWTKVIDQSDGFVKGPQ